jgi:hypothetical protein
MVCPSFVVADAANTVTVPDVSVSPDAGAIVIEAGVLSGDVVPEGPESPPQATAVNTKPRNIGRDTCTEMGERWEGLRACRRRQAGEKHERYSMMFRVSVCKGDQCRDQNRDPRWMSNRQRRSGQIASQMPKTD